MERDGLSSMLVSGCELYCMIIYKTVCSKCNID